MPHSSTSNVSLDFQSRRFLCLCVTLQHSFHPGDTHLISGFCLEARGGDTAMPSLSPHPTTPPLSKRSVPVLQTWLLAESRKGQRCVCVCVKERMRRRKGERGDNKTQATTWRQQATHTENSTNPAWDTGRAVSSLGPCPGRQNGTVCSCVCMCGCPSSFWLHANKSWQKKGSHVWACIIWKSINTLKLSW